MHDVLFTVTFVMSGDVEKHVCPVIIELACAESPDDFRTEAVAVGELNSFVTNNCLTE